MRLKIRRLNILKRTTTARTESSATNGAFGGVIPIPYGTYDKLVEDMTVFEANYLAFGSRPPFCKMQFLIGEESPPCFLTADGNHIMLQLS